MEVVAPLFKKKLGLLDATMIVAGSMVGSGIFIVSSLMVQDVGSAGWLIFAWVLTSFMTIAGALTIVELSALYPKAGGMYVYLKEAYNPLIGFLYGWSFFTVIQTGMIAAVAVAFSKFTAYIFPFFSEQHILADFGLFKFSAAQALGIVHIIILTFINTKGIVLGKNIQNVLTIVKLVTLLGLIILGFSLAFDWNVWQANWNTPFEMIRHASRFNLASHDDVWLKVKGMAGFGAVAAAMVGAILTSDAWYNITFIAGEVKNPERNVGRSLFLGTTIVCVLYILMNIMYLAVLPLGISGTDTQSIAFATDGLVGTAAAFQVFGNNGTFIVAILLMLSTLGCNNGLIISGARVYYTMAKDQLFFRRTATLNKHAVPAYGIWLQCIVAIVLCLSGKYGDLLDYISFVVMLFYILTAFGVVILRRKKPDLHRPYKAFAYPYLTFVYIALAGIFCISLLLYHPGYALMGLLILLAGVPIYFWIISRQSISSSTK